jgi:hypothetical protein
MMTSTRVGSLPGGYIAGWDGSPEPLSIWHVPILPDARVYEVHGPSDWASFTKDIDGQFVSDEWDGVHLSMAGYLTVPSFGHWLHESTLWLRSAFGGVSRLPDWPYREHFINYDWPPPGWPAAGSADEIGGSAGHVE